MKKMDLDESTKIRKRPIGVTVLAAFHLLGVVLGLFLFLPFDFNNPQLASILKKLDATTAQLIFNFVFLFFLVVLSGVGMLLGKWWGWFLAANYYLNSILRNGYTILMIEQIYLHLDPDDPEIHQAYTKYGARLAINFLLLVYLLRDNVLSYFGIQVKRKFITLALVFAVSIIELTISALI